MNTWSSDTLETEDIKNITVNITGTPTTAFDVRIRENDIGMRLPGLAIAPKIGQSIELVYTTTEAVYVIEVTVARIDFVRGMIYCDAVLKKPLEPLVKDSIKSWNQKAKLASMLAMESLLNRKKYWDIGDSSPEMGPLAKTILYFNGVDHPGRIRTWGEEGLAIVSDEGLLEASGDVLVFVQFISPNEKIILHGNIERTVAIPLEEGSLAGIVCRVEPDERYRARARARQCYEQTIKSQRNID